MLRKPEYNETYTHIICECSVAEDDMQYEIIQESSAVDMQGNKIPVVTMLVCLQSFGVQNWNQRIYDSNVVMPALDNDGMIQNDINHGQWIGEFGHPLDLDIRRQMTMDPKTSSHRILKYWKEGNLLKGHVRTLPYGYGVAMANNTLEGVPSSFSLRALGGVDTVTRRIKPGLKPITYDSVYRPSHREAYEEELLTESADGFTKGDNGIYLPTSHELGSIMMESAVFHELDNGGIVKNQIEEYIKDKSDNIKIISDMFKIDNFNGTLNESGTHMNIKHDDLILNVPVEHVINMQYYGLLNDRKISRR